MVEGDGEGVRWVHHAQTHISDLFGSVWHHELTNCQSVGNSAGEVHVVNILLGQGLIDCVVKVLPMIFSSVHRIEVDVSTSNGAHKMSCAKLMLDQPILSKNEMVNSDSV